jgi:hypothetical protein
MVFLEGNMDQENALCDKMQSFFMLQWVGHIITSRLDIVNGVNSWRHVLLT